jgi:hypothetical protein
LSITCGPVHQLGIRTIDRHGGREALLLVRAEAHGLSTFWLDMAVRHDAKLKDVDGFLRRTWLECCGHMSEFFTGAHRRGDHEH